jgi:hypothetical protein
VGEWIRRQRNDDPDVPQTYYLLRDLEPQTWYQLEVVANNNIGRSPPNDFFCFQTRDGEFNSSNANLAHREVRLL